MPDMEKVVKGLESCLRMGRLGVENCRELNCPYFENGLRLSCWIDVLADALALLKEPEAVKPKSKSRHGEYPQIVHRCGNCNEILYRYYKFCPTCGRSVKWNEMVLL